MRFPHAETARETVGEAGSCEHRHMQELEDMRRIWRRAAWSERREGVGVAVRRTAGELPRAPHEMRVAARRAPRKSESGASRHLS